MLLVHQGLYDGIELLIIDRVFLPSFVQLLTKVDNGVSFQTQYHLFLPPSHYKLLRKLLKNQVTLKLVPMSFFLILPRTPLQLLLTCKLPPFHAVRNGSHNGIESLNEPMVKYSQTVKTSNFINIGRFRPIPNNLHLLKVRNYR